MSLLNSNHLFHTSFIIQIFKQNFLLKIEEIIKILVFYYVIKFLQPGKINKSGSENVSCFH